MGGLVAGARRVQGYVVGFPQGRREFRPSNARGFCRPNSQNTTNHKPRCRGGSTRETPKRPWWGNGHLYVLRQGCPSLAELRDDRGAVREARCQSLVLTHQLAKYLVLGYLGQRWPLCGFSFLYTAMCLTCSPSVSASGARFCGCNEVRRCTCVAFCDEVGGVGGVSMHTMKRPPKVNLGTYSFWKSDYFTFGSLTNGHIKRQLGPLN